MAARLTALWAVSMLAAIATAPPALADAAGPTDYRTDIVSISPPTSAFRVEMIGGDAFMGLEQLEPVEIVVLGYQGEPYLRFASDGTVSENRRSPARWLNQERYGNEQAPAFANPTANPEWFEVASNGRYAWHDHRSHWMNSSPPPSAQAGDQVLEATVPIRVEDQLVTVTVASFLLEKPSVLAPTIGALSGLAAVLFSWRSNRVARSLVALLIAGGAALLGAIAFTSVPSETEPSTLLWFLPGLAMAAVVVLIVSRNHTATTVYLDGLAVTAGAALAGWAFMRFDALSRALIPSDAPAVLDRFAIGAALVVGIALGVHGLLGLLRPQRLISVQATS